MSHIIGIIFTQIRQLHGRMDPQMEQDLLMQSQRLGAQLEKQKDVLKKGGLNALKGMAWHRGGCGMAG